LEPEDDKANPHKSRDDCPSIPPSRGKSPRDQEGEAVTDAEGEEEPSCRPMGEGKSIFDQGEDG
jgi:hypothetical protein